MGAGAGAKATSKPSGDDAGALAAEIDRRGLVRHGDAFSSRHKGVSWDKQAQTWRARLKHGGKTPKLGYFGTEAEAKARRDARCRELGIDTGGASLGFRGMTNFEAARPLAEEPQEEGLLLPDAHDAVGPAAAREGQGEVSASLLRYLGLPAGASPGEIGAALAAELADGASTADEDNTSLLET